MSLARCMVLLALILIVMPGIAAAESAAAPADLGKELVRVLSGGPQGFILVQADEKPSVKVGNHKGFRILLRREERVPDPNSTQQQQINGAELKTITVRSHIDLVLFPDGQINPKDLKTRIKWLDVEQQQGFVKPVYMGKGHGYYWFGRTTIYWQDWVRRRMELTGGDDRAALAIEGMEVKDDGTMTRNSVYAIFHDLGDAAVPALEAAIREHENDGPGRYISQLDYIGTEKSTSLLRKLYHSTNPEVSNKAALSLAYGFSARSSAKPEYLDMLHRRAQTISVAEICAKYGWKEAVPDLEAILALPPSWWDFKAAYLAHRSLTGRPVAETVVQAGERFRYAGKAGEDARSLLAAAEDKEAVAVLVIGQYQGRGKMSLEDEEKYDRLALDLLGKLPPEIVLPVVENGARTVTARYDKEWLTKLLGELRGMVDG